MSGRLLGLPDPDLLTTVTTGVPAATAADEALVRTRVDARRMAPVTCLMRVWHLARRSVVEFAESDDNPGLPVRSAFPDLVTRAREAVPYGAVPVWIEYWPQRALATLILHGTAEPARHLWTQAHDGSWQRTPMTLPDLQALLRESDSDGVRAVDRPGLGTGRPRMDPFPNS